MGRADKLKAPATGMTVRSGEAPHPATSNAIEPVAEASESAAAFQQLAEARWARLVETGQSVTLDHVEAYLVARAAQARSMVRSPR